MYSNGERSGGNSIGDGDYDGGGRCDVKPFKKMQSEPWMMQLLLDPSNPLPDGQIFNRPCVIFVNDRGFMEAWPNGRVLFRRREPPRSSPINNNDDESRSTNGDGRNDDDDTDPKYLLTSSSGLKMRFRRIRPRSTNGDGQHDDEETDPKYSLTYSSDGEMTIRTFFSKSILRPNSDNAGGNDDEPPLTYSATESSRNIVSSSSQAAAAVDDFRSNDLYDLGVGRRRFHLVITKYQFRVRLDDRENIVLSLIVDEAMFWENYYIHSLEFDRLWPSDEYRSSKLFDLIREKFGHTKLRPVYEFVKMGEVEDKEKAAKEQDSSSNSHITHIFAAFSSENRSNSQSQRASEHTPCVSYKSGQFSSDSAAVRDLFDHPDSMYQGSDRSTVGDQSRNGRQLTHHPNQTISLSSASRTDIRSPPLVDETLTQTISSTSAADPSQLLSQFLAHSAPSITQPCVDNGQIKITVRNARLQTDPKLTGWKEGLNVRQASLMPHVLREDVVLEPTIIDDSSAAAEPATTGVGDLSMITDDEEEGGGNGWESQRISSDNGMDDPTQPIVMQSSFDQGLQRLDDQASNGDLFDDDIERRELSREADVENGGDDSIIIDVVGDSAEDDEMSPPDGLDRTQSAKNISTNGKSTSEKSTRRIDEWQANRNREDTDDEDDDEPIIDMSRRTTRATTRRPPPNYDDGESPNAGTSRQAVRPKASRSTNRKRASRNDNADIATELYYASRQFKLPDELMKLCVDEMMK